VFNLGAQELLILGCCGALPVIAVIVAVMTRRTVRPRDEDDDF
jgi:hypothetical protein